MEERQIAENIMKALGNSLVNKDDVTLGGSQIAERYKSNLAKAGYDLMKYDDCINALHHYVVCAGYDKGKFVYVLSDYRIS